MLLLQLIKIYNFGFGLFDPFLPQGENFYQNNKGVKLCVLPFFWAWGSSALGLRISGLVVCTLVTGQVVFHSH